MNKWLSIGVASESVHKDWENVHHAHEVEARKKLSAEIEKEASEGRKRTQKENYSRITLLRLNMLPLDWITPECAARYWGQTVQHARKRLAQLMVSGQVEQRRNGRQVEYRRIVL